MIIAFIAVYGSITFAQSATDNCYFSIDYRTIFDGPCNEKIAEIEANFETRYEQFIFSQGISSGEDFFAYVLEQEKKKRFLLNTPTMSLHISKFIGMQSLVLAMHIVWWDLANWMKAIQGV